MACATGQVERLAKLPFASTSDEKHLEQLKQAREDHWCNGAAIATAVRP